MIPSKELIDKESALLTAWGEVGKGFSKTFRTQWAEKPIAERIPWLEMLIREALFEKAVMEVRRI